MTTKANDETTNEDDNSHIIVLERDGSPPVRFRGWFTGEGSSREHSGHSNSRWTEIRIYETVSGKTILGIIGRTIWQDEHDMRKVVVVPSTDHKAIAKALADQNDGWLSDVAKDAMRDAGIALDAIAEDID